jgi:GntR family transcriptional repressor for pyruvate dehydrogenase complex
MAALPRMTVASKIAEDIKQRIISKQYRPGDRLPTERALAEQYQVSRIPVREALRSLEQMGLVATHHGRGSFVTEADAKPILDMFSQQLLLNAPSMMDLLKVRALLEKQAAMDAAALRTQAELDAIRQAEARCRLEIEKARLGLEHAFHEADFALHEAIAAASHNDLFKGFFGIIYNSIRMHQSMAISADKTADRLRTFHAAICDAIARQDAEAAGAAMAAHMEHVTDLVRSGQEKLAALMARDAAKPEA